MSPFFFLLDFSPFLFFCSPSIRYLGIRSDRIGSRLGAQCHVAQQPNSMSVAGSVRARHRCRRRCRCRCRSQMGRLFPSRNLLLRGVVCWAYGQDCMARAAMNQSVFGGRGGERPVRVSPGATRAFSSLSVFCVSVQSGFSLFPTAPFVSLFPPSAKHSPGPGPGPGPGQGRCALFGIDSPLPVFFFGRPSLLLPSLLHELIGAAVRLAVCALGVCPDIGSDKRFGTHSAMCAMQPITCYGWDGSAELGMTPVQAVP